MDDPETGEQLLVRAAGPLAGLHKLLAALKEINGLTQLDNVESYVVNFILIYVAVLGNECQNSVLASGALWPSCALKESICQARSSDGSCVTKQD